MATDTPGGETGTRTQRARGTLVKGSSSSLEQVAAAFVGVGVLAMLGGIAVVAQQLEATTTLFGVEVAVLFGLAMALSGLALLAFGGLSRYELVETDPDPTAGVGVGIGYAVVGFFTGAALGTQTLSLPVVGGLFVALVGAVGAFAVTVVPREDVGATVVPGALTFVLGAAVLTDVLTASGNWTPDAFSIVVPGGEAIAILALFTGLLVTWTAARAYGGFGSAGKEFGAHVLVTANAAWMMGLLFVIVAFIVGKGLAPVLEGIKLGLFTRPVFWFHAPILNEYVIFHAPGVWFYWPFAMNGASLLTDINGVMPAIIGTFWLVLGAIVFAVPLGVGAAVFLTEYAEQGRFTQLVEVSTNGLWSTPSIVYGLFGLAFLVPRLGNNSSILAGQLVLGAMLLPLVVITSREALKSVPDEYRDASAALGVGKWHTIKDVVLPAAMPGVITGVILGVGRIAGETAPLLLVTGGEPFPSNGPGVLQSFQVNFAIDGAFPFVHFGVSNPALLEASSALPYQLFAVITAGVGENLEFAWGTALMLLLVVLSFYAVGIVSRIYFRRKLQA